MSKETVLAQPVSRRDFLRFGFLLPTSLSRLSLSPTPRNDSRSLRIAKEETKETPFQIELPYFQDIIDHALQFDSMRSKEYTPTYVQHTPEEIKDILLNNGNAWFAQHEEGGKIEKIDVSSTNDTAHIEAKVSDVYLDLPGPFDGTIGGTINVDYYTGVDEENPERNELKVDDADINITGPDVATERFDDPVEDVIENPAGYVEKLLRPQCEIEGVDLHRVDMWLENGLLSVMFHATKRAVTEN